MVRKLWLRGSGGCGCVVFHGSQVMLGLNERMSRHLGCLVKICAMLSVRAVVQREVFLTSIVRCLPMSTQEECCRRGQIPHQVNGIISDSLQTVRKPGIGVDMGKRTADEPRLGAVRHQTPKRAGTQFPGRVLKPHIKTPGTCILIPWALQSLCRGVLSRLQGSHEPFNSFSMLPTSQFFPAKLASTCRSSCTFFPLSSH